MSVAAGDERDGVVGTSEFQGGQEDLRRVRAREGPRLDRLPSGCRTRSSGCCSENEFFATPYGRGLWVSVWADGRVDWRAVEDLVERSYRVVALKRMLTALEAEDASEVNVMRYMLLTRADQDTLLEQLSAMPAVLDEVFGGLSAADARVEGADGFSPVEQCWHLADLERDGYARAHSTAAERGRAGAAGFRRRARRAGAQLQVAVARGRSRGVPPRAGREPRCAPRAERDREWERRGTQEGVGRVGLCDIPAMMAEHDAAHRAEIEEWKRGRSKGKRQRSKVRTR